MRSASRRWSRPSASLAPSIYGRVPATLVRGRLRKRRRMDPVRDFAHLIEWAVPASRRLSQHVPQFLGSRSEIACRRAELHRERGQALLRPVVQIPLDTAAVFVCGRDDAGRVSRFARIRASEIAVATSSAKRVSRDSVSPATGSGSYAPASRVRISEARAALVARLRGMGLGQPWRLAEGERQEDAVGLGTAGRCSRVSPAVPGSPDVSRVAGIEADVKLMWRPQATSLT